MSDVFELTLEMVRALQAIERARETVRLTVLPPVLAERLRLDAQVRSTHFSTRIEGNHLTLEEAQGVIERNLQIPGRERGVGEVERYYRALQQIESWVVEQQALTEERIRKLHAILFRGKRAKPTPYRDGQNVIRDSSGSLVYLPPEAADVPPLMKEFVAWMDHAWVEIPIPIIAGMVHYQFVTIHPFYDGNGRTARALTTWILYRGGYDLGKFYSLEEFYARELEGYYAALVTHPTHNYDEGRMDAPVTSWLAYFLEGMAEVFAKVAQSVSDGQAQEALLEAPLLRELDQRARRILGLFAHQSTICSADVAGVLGLSQRQARELLAGWVEAGWLIVADPSRRGRKYALAPAYRQFVE